MNKNNYCVKCRKFTINVKPRIVKTKNNRYATISYCDICKTKKYSFISKNTTVKKKKVGGLLNSIINKIPFEMHVPGYNYCGPGTKLEKRLAKGDVGINTLDEACRKHDIHYEKYKTAEERHPADLQLADVASDVINNSKSKFKEKIVARIVRGVMNSKVKLGMGLSE
jgi:Phospholipase A2-like domain